MRASPGWNSAVVFSRRAQRRQARHGGSGVSLADTVFVMPGLDPATICFEKILCRLMDARVKPAHDES
jgi:hypothetical protein